MKKIKYEIDGKVVEVEVDDSFVEKYEIIDKESKRNDWKFDFRNRKYHCSIDNIEENGFQIPSSDIEPEEALEKEELLKKIKDAIKSLNPEQQEIVNRLYFKGEKAVDVAREMGITKQSLRDRQEIILKKLKNFLQI